MISDDRPDKFQRTPRKEVIERISIEADSVANRLRNILICRCPGSKDTEYKLFITHFGYLYNVTHHKKELNQEIITKCKKWFLTPRSTASRKNIIRGLELYDEYISELFKHGLLTYD